MAQMEKIRCAILRGGTSKAMFLMENDLPRDVEARDKVILKVFGSPDVRQIDGLGGADPLTSKLAIIGPSSRPDADVDYTFGQVSINKPYVDYSGNCGNISSAVGPFAIDEGLVRCQEGITTVRIHNTNTGKLIIADVPTVDGKAAVLGDCVCDGVPGTGAMIMLDYSDTTGAVTNKLLPTGNPTDVLDIPGFGKIEASLVDVANPMVFVRAKDLGLTGIETPQQVNSNPELLKTLESIRGTAAVMMGMATDLKDALERVPAFPMIAFVSPPQDYTDFTTGNPVKAEDVDLVSRLMFMQVIHKTYAGTGTVCTGSAAVIPGTVVYEQIDRPREKSLLRIGHPAGVIDIEMASDITDGKVAITRAAISRTARRIMDGSVYVLPEKK
jgi:2-methylaconitate cis-trans-isomerase PrpF